MYNVFFSSFWFAHKSQNIRSQFEFLGMTKICETRWSSRLSFETKSRPSALPTSRWSLERILSTNQSTKLLGISWAWINSNFGCFLILRILNDMSIISTFNTLHFHMFYVYEDLVEKKVSLSIDQLGKKKAKKDGRIGLQSRYQVQTLNPCRQCAMEDHLQKPRRWRNAAMKIHETWVGDMFLFRLSKKILLVLTRTRAAPRIQEVKDIDSQSGTMSKIKWL